VVFGRKPPRTQTEQMMDELAESYSHFKQAAGHVAGGTAQKLTPTYDRARNAALRSWSTTRDAFSPLYLQMQEGAANARREREVSKKNRWPALVGLLAAGAAVGAASAMVVRRRRAASQWDGYEPLPEATEGPYGESKVSTATSKVSAGAASVAESVSTQAGKLAESLQEKAKSADMPKATGTSKPAPKPETIDDDR
jgi:hypothetical protein